MRRQVVPLAPLRALFGPDAAAVRQSFVALALNSSTSFVAGAFLGSISGTLDKYPGLLVLVPAAIGLRGNIFGAFGNRMSTAIHAGTFRMSLRREAVLGQNVQACIVLTMAVSVALAIEARGIAGGVLNDSIGLLTMSTISVAGGLMGSVVVLGAALGLTAGAVRYNWDLDNVTAPLVSTLGDVLTLPALWLATFLVGIAYVSTAIGLVLVGVSLAALVVGWRSRGPALRRVVRESMPVLVVAGFISALAGVALEHQYNRFNALPALLLLVPVHLSSGGALGGILSGRLSSKLFLGLVRPDPWPNREARRDIAFVLTLALPVFVFNALGTEAFALALGKASPGLGWMIALSVLGGVLVIGFVVAVSYYGTIAAYRTGTDPDTYGIPVVSSLCDFMGALALVAVIIALGLA
jgi:mgtE-like transporter